MIHDGCRQTELTCRVCGGEVISNNLHCRPGICDLCYKEMGEELSAWTKWMERGGKDDLEGEEK